MARSSAHNNKIIDKPVTIADNALIMKTQIEILKNYFGSLEKVALELGISMRQLRNVKRDIHVGKPLKNLINQLVAKIKDKP